MQIQDLKVTIKRKARRRVGRGGKRGTYSGRGIKGQKARTNKRLKLKRIGSALGRHLPKLGGFVSKHPKAQAVDILTLEKMFGAGEKVNPKTLKNKGIIKDTNRPVKILGNGKISKKFVIEQCLVSESAKEQIKKSGGVLKIIENTDKKAAGAAK